MSAATVDRYLVAALQASWLKGCRSTKPGLLLCNSTSIREAGDELANVPGLLECDTDAHCVPAPQGEIARTLAVTDMSTGWTECLSIRDNASEGVLAAAEELHEAFPFPVTGFDLDNGTESINHDGAGWLLAHDIAFTRSKPYKNNDQAALGSKKNDVVRKHAFD